MSEQQSGDCQACMRRATALARSGHAEGCQVAALEAELETLRRERDELVRWRHERTKVHLRAGPNPAGVTLISHAFGAAPFHFSDAACNLFYPDGSTECAWLAANPLPVEVQG